MLRTIARNIGPIAWVYRGLRSLVWYSRFLKEFLRFKSISAKRDGAFPVRWRDRDVVLGEWTNTHGFDRHYVYHPAWAARTIARIGPECVVDVSSTLYFATLVSAFIPVHYYEFRNVNVSLTNLTCGSADLISLPFEDNSISCLTCMHVVEHIGLGRYGDPLNPIGDGQAMEELARVLGIGGSLLFVVPVGKPRLMFNAQRVYSYDQILRRFSGLRLQEFALIPDDPRDGGLIPCATKEMADAQRYGCGCFWFIKDVSPASVGLGRMGRQMGSEPLVRGG